MSAAEYYNHGTYPATGSNGSSAAMRSELELIKDGFGKLPTLAGNGCAIVVVKADASGLEAVAGATINLSGTSSVNLSGGDFVFPQGEAAAPTAEGKAYWNITNDVLTVGTGTVAKTMADTSSVQTLTNKTLTSPTLTSPTLTSPVLNTVTSGVITACTGSPTLTITNCTGSPTLTAPLLGTPASGTLTNCTADGTTSVGFKSIPQNSQSANYTLAITDSGKHLYHPSADTTARTWTIPANSSVAFPIGTAVTFINGTTAGVITIGITSDTLRLVITGATGNRILAVNGIATAIKIGTTEWIISGVGLS